MAKMPSLQRLLVITTKDMLDQFAYMSFFNVST